MSDEKLTEEANEIYRRNSTRDLDKVFTTAFKEIIDHQRDFEVRGRCPIDVFEHIYLPYFAGYVDKLPDDCGMDVWFRHAGGYTNEMDIVDNNGNVLFTVPPIASSRHLVGKEDNDFVIGSVVKESVLLKQDRPDLAKSSIERAVLASVPDRLVDVKDDYYRRWAEIFLRYGYDPKERVGLEREDTNKEVENDRSQGLEIDQWD